LLLAQSAHSAELLKLQMTVNARWDTKTMANHVHLVLRNIWLLVPNARMVTAD